MKNRKSKNGRMTASGVAAASPFDALSFSEYSESSSVASACACLAERSDATCSKTSTRRNLTRGNLGNEKGGSSFTNGLI